MTEAEFHRAAFGTPDGRERRYPGVTRRRRRPAATSTRCTGNRCPSARHPAGRERLWRARSDRERLGVDGSRCSRRSRGSRRWRPIPVLGRLLRRRAFRAQGRVARDAARPRAPHLPQLVPPSLSLCLCHVPLRALRSRPASLPPSAVATTSRAGLLAQPKRLPARYFYDALGSALFEAICRLPWYRITRSESALLARHARRSSMPRARTPRSSSLAAAAARSWRS